ncbi:ATP-binding protein [Streptomyces sp. NPDC006208]|uniref:ATP-binding protein n=1 Tax=Streptomyces sp. NPDC006208 TaxID=3156734 RepID=UPI0033B7EF2A
MARYGFETNIPELTRRLGLNLYNDPTISLRELLQNANDACILAEGLLGAPKGRIDISVDSKNHRLSITDSGIGMDERCLKEVLSTIASSTKAELRKELERKHFKPARGIAGQFGIGFLSTFIIADDVHIETRHQQESGPGSLWHSKGDGYYDLRPSPKPLSRGTTVTLVLKEEFRNKINTMTITEALAKYCPFIRTPYYINSSALPANHELPPWSDTDNQGLADAYLRSNFNRRPLVNFYIDHDGPVIIGSESVPHLSISGYLAIPDQQFWSEEPRVYTSGLYVGEIRDGLPSWARFVLGGIECPDLDLTLGRDDVMKNTTWRAVKKVVAGKLTEAMVRDLSDRRSRIRQRWNSVFDIHAEDIMRSAVEDARYGEGDFYRAVRDIIPFRIGGERMSLATAITQGKCIEEGGKKVLFYFAQGFRRHESAGVQESLLFDERGLHFIDARNFYERDFLQQYGADNSSLALVPIEEGLEYVLNFECDADDARIISETYRALGYNARLSKFEPSELAGVIVPVGEQDGHDRELDWSTPEGREEVIQLLVGAASPGNYRPYTLCINANNILVQEILRYAREHGVDSHIKLALKQIYFMSVLVFGDANTRVIAEMAPSLSSLMLSFLRRSTDLDSELARLRQMVSEAQKRVGEKEAELLRSGILKREDGTVFLAYGYDEPTAQLVQTFKHLLQDRGISVIDGQVDAAGSLSEQILRRIRSSSMFVGVLTPRDKIAGDGGSIASTWVIEEKGAARACGIPVLLIVDKGVAQQFYGNLEGDNVRIAVGDQPADWVDAFRRATNMIVETLRQTPNHD